MTISTDNMHGLLPSALKLAIINENILAGIGLQNILEDMLPYAEIVLCRDIKYIEESALCQCAHYFVSSNIYFSCTDFFQKYNKKTIVLINGDITIKGTRTLNICQDEKELIKNIIALHRAGHGKINTEETKKALLSSREAQVMILLCKGYINKEIAEKLNISLTTVMTHRKNINAKINAHSLADIIIYAVINGYINISEL